MPNYLLLVVLMAAGYAYFFYQRGKMQKAGGIDAISRPKLDSLFRLSGGERVTAAWSATTVPKLGAVAKTAEVVGAAAAVVGGVGVRFVGRPLGIACTTRNRVL